MAAVVSSFHLPQWIQQCIIQMHPNKKAQGLKAEQIHQLQPKISTAKNIVGILCCPLYSQHLTHTTLEFWSYYIFYILPLEVLLITFGHKMWSLISPFLLHPHHNTAVVQSPSAPSSRCQFVVANIANVAFSQTGNYSNC